MSCYNPIQKAYDLMVGFVHENKTTDLEEVIGYLGEALDYQEDSIEDNYDRNKAPQDSPVDFVGDANVQYQFVIATPSEPHIKDSGKRTEFTTGAVRDMREGKGRCDLMPLHVLGDFLKNGIFTHLAHFLEDPTKTQHLYDCLYMAWHMWDSKPTMFLEVAKHFEEGAKKYGENNWQKGIPVHCYIDSAVRHYLKWLRGDKDEPHDRAFVWNLMCCIWEVDYRDKDKEKQNDVS